MPWLVEVELDEWEQQAQAMGTLTWLGLTHQCGGRHTDAAWSASGACCLVSRALIRDALVGTRSQEAP